MTTATNTIAAPDYVNGQLSALLKAETAEVHNDAENTRFMSRLLDGKLTIHAVAELAGQLYFVYAALEQAARASSQSSELQAVFDTRLERLDALTADLEFLYGEQWREHISPLKATQDYLDKLQNIEANADGQAALAHHYVRYLGDMSGGQVIARMFEKHYGLKHGGTSFYNFDVIGRIKPYRDAYRIRLNELELSADEKRRIVEEAKAAFKLNEAIFHALDERH